MKDVIPTMCVSGCGRVRCEADIPALATRHNKQVGRSVYGMALSTSGSGQEGGVIVMTLH